MALGPQQFFEPRKVDTEHPPVEEEERGQRLVLGRRGDVAPDGEVSERR
jgi:hypothetical protein